MLFRQSIPPSGSHFEIDLIAMISRFATWPIGPVSILRIVPPRNGAFPQDAVQSGCVPPGEFQGPLLNHLAVPAGTPVGDRELPATTSFVSRQSAVLSCGSGLLLSNVFWRSTAARHLAESAGRTTQRKPV